MTRPVGTRLLPNGPPSAGVRGPEVRFPGVPIPGMAVDASSWAIVSSYEAPLAAPYEALSGSPKSLPGAVHSRRGCGVRVSAP
ncbi:hypothetical protein [Streptomyces sp. SID11385]|uniref:hypothetical protein n=1 Tax=Streptomyces sp. SID11385 TaxID=2706031 RepID=UPI0013C72F36|nr:hypothetical protein [Streptomyces sp. SID11385]NEA39742.1 hypothetical protein [Streptomyces sp. SID11385]